MRASTLARPRAGRTRSSRPPACRIGRDAHPLPRRRRDIENRSDILGHMNWPSRRASSPIHGRNRLSSIRCVSVAILAICLAKPASAETGAVSLVGAWQSCDPQGCSLRFAFMPNGRVIKQYRLRSATVTAYGRYQQESGMLQIVWTRFSPRRVCGLSPRAVQNQSSCKRTAEPNLKGPLRFKGFNALVWTIPTAKALRLNRIEE
jgi:hypothetical protein